ncbi:MAG: hypothetical protein IKZ44_04100 [Clostridia bacterium]|nr:hypothetical protein [Clostridia bacterium]
MAEAIRLKSRATKVYDYRCADISEFVVGFTVDEEQYQKDLTRVLKRYGNKAEAETVASGDTATVACISDFPRFNKAGIPVIVGKGVFDAALEAALIGMRKGETKIVDKDGQTVTMTVERIVHTELPALSDETVASFGMEGIQTVKDLRRSLIGRQVEGFILEDENADMASAYVWQEVANHSVVERDPEEYAHILKAAEKKIEGFKEEQTAGMDHDALVNLFVAELDLAAIGQGMMEAEGTYYSTDDYAAYIDRLVEAYPDRTRAGVEAEHTVLDYAIEHYANFLAGAIDRTVAEKYKAILTKEC